MPGHEMTDHFTFGSAPPTADLLRRRVDAVLREGSPKQFGDIATILDEGTADVQYDQSERWGRRVTCSEREWRKRGGGNDTLQRLSAGELHGLSILLRPACMADAVNAKMRMAEEEGFEPPCESPRKRFSRPPVSTTHPFLRARYPYYTRLTRYPLGTATHPACYSANRASASPRHAPVRRQLDSCA